MTYVVGSLIAAIDYMTFRGSTDPDTAYASSLAAQNKIAGLIGIGYGDRGYGLTTTTLPTVSGGTTVATAAQWNSLRTVMSTLNTHTGAGLTLQPTLTSGSLIIAQDGRSGQTDIAALIAALDTDRFVLSASQSSVSTVLTSTRTTSWTSVFHEFTTVFTAEDQARYFFNTGGEVRLTASRTGGTSNSPNAAVTAMLTAMGTIKFGAASTTYTGTGGTVANIGYYDLTATYQVLFTHYGTGAYSNVSYVVTAKRENYTGANGGNGATIRFRATFSVTSYTGITIDGTTTSSIASYKSAGVVNTTSPTYTTTSNL